MKGERAERFHLCITVRKTWRERKKGKEGKRKEKIIKGKSRKIKGNQGGKVGSQGEGEKEE